VVYLCIQYLNYPVPAYIQFQHHGCRLVATNVVQWKAPTGILSLFKSEKGTERILINQIFLNNTIQSTSSFTKMIVLFRTK
jgi:hypothetical protein